MYYCPEVDVVVRVLARIKSHHLGEVVRVIYNAIDRAYAAVSGQLAAGRAVVGIELVVCALVSARGEPRRGSCNGSGDAVKIAVSERGHVARDVYALASVEYAAINCAGA